MTDLGLTKERKRKMKKEYVTPRLTNYTLKSGVMLGPGNPIAGSNQNPNPDLGRSRGGIFEDEPTESSNSGYNRSLW